MAMPMPKGDRIDYPMDRVKAPPKKAVPAAMKKAAGRQALLAQMKGSC